MLSDWMTSMRQKEQTLGFEIISETLSDLKYQEYI